MSDPHNSTDAYAHALEVQNNGGVCEHCNSALGHRSTCPLICRETAEAHSIALGNVTEADRIIARGWGVAL
jgi:hypothetical protein